MEKTPVSIIVPVYNTQQYLSYCVESVLLQTYENWELILVDDGSLDNCPKICDEYARKDNRIKVIHKQNGGLSDARNKGLKIATGEYVCFLDSDDILDSYFLERMLAVAKRHNADWVQCSALFGSDRILNGKRDCKEEILAGKNALLYDSIKVRVWGCLFARWLFEDLCFPNRKIYEDEAIYYKLLYSSKRAVRIDDELYYYYFNKDSLSKKETDYIDDTFIEIFQERINYFRQKHDKKMVVKSKEKFCRSLMVIYVRCKKNKNNKNDTKKYLKQIRRLTRQTVFSCIPSFKSKMQCICFSLFPKLATKFSIKHKLNSRFI